jgi:hypothetical protein
MRHSISTQTEEDVVVMIMNNMKDSECDSEEERSTPVTFDGLMFYFQINLLSLLFQVPHVIHTAQSTSNLSVMSTCPTDVYTIEQLATRRVDTDVDNSHVIFIGLFVICVMNFFYLNI